MSNEKGTALAKKDDRGFSELVRDGANLSPAEWDTARIAAAKEFLPREFRSNPAHMIAFLARANRSGLDPFLGELYAWKDERGDLTFMTARDGFLKALRRDDNIDGPPEVQIVYEDDEFWYEKDGQGNITIHHKGGFKRGEPLGAYCLIRTKEGPDHLEMRELSDFAHLRNKNNWRNYPLDMIQTRVLSAAARLATNVVAGIYSEADFEMVEDGRRMARVDSATVQGHTEDRAADLRDRLASAQEENGSYTEPVEAQATEEEEPESGRSWEELEEEAAPENMKPRPKPGEKHDPGPDVEPGVPPTEPEPELDDEEEGGFESTYENTCPICERDDFNSPQEYAGHMSGHSKRGETAPGKPDEGSEQESSESSPDTSDDLESMSKGELLTLAYDEAKDRGLDLHEIVKEVAGTDDDGNPISLMDLDADGRVAIVEEIRRR